jgi:PAS domain S-box-containing protein
MQAAQVAKKKQILVVEDEGLIAEDVRRRLERLGYAVPDVAASGREALRLARANVLDLVLMDIHLQGDMDGIATAKAMWEELRLPVIYMTAHADEETVSRATATGPLAYILKPVSDLSLRSTVQIALYRHEMEDRVHASEAWLEATLRNVVDGILATGPSGEVLFLNAAAEQLTGWSGAEAKGRTLLDVLQLHEESGDDTRAIWPLDLRAGERRYYRLASRANGGTPVEVCCAENRAEAKRLGSILVLRDIRAQREMEGRMIQSQRMEAIANMAGGLAHDFNNLLMVVLGYADELAKDLPNAKDRERAMAIKQAATVASSISRQLLTLSRREVSKTELIELDGVIAEMEPLLAQSLGSGCKLVLELGSSAALVRADRNRFKQVFLNLAMNARDAMKERGELRISTSRIEIGAANPHWPNCRAGRYLRIRVQDSGQGMDDATLPRIFEPFFTTKQPGSGTGLGLAVVHAIITQSEGYIMAASEVGKGTSFEILLPRAEKSQKATDPPKAAGMAAGAPRVLVVDDEDGVRRLMHGCLKREGYEMLEARDAEEAERIARACPGPIHLLVTDVAMPGMSGPQLAARLKPLRPEMKTLFVTGSGSDMLDRAGLSPEELLAKPFQVPELTSRVRRLVRRAPAFVPWGGGANA